ncbi:MAG: GPW/gp25 family protein [Anaerolineales bacterium]|nr:GPW/gp25 family protein [Anaerolineales bacterium]MCB8951968.1 GPW/gp25 family protein [Ardenticatenales bacterium]
MSNDIIGRGWAFPPQVNAQGGLALTSENSEIEQAILIILSTAPGQRVMRPTFGCRLHDLVFAPNTLQTATQARRYVEEALGMWEPRIEVKKVTVQPDPKVGNCLSIDIQYQLKATRDQRTLTYPFYLIPSEIGPIFSGENGH